MKKENSEHAIKCVKCYYAYCELKAADKVLNPGVFHGKSTIYIVPCMYSADLMQEIPGSGDAVCVPLEETEYVSGLYIIRGWKFPC